MTVKQQVDRKIAALNALTAYRKAVDSRDAVIAFAYGAGVQVTEIARITGLNRSYVHHLLKHRAEVQS